MNTVIKYMTWNSSGFNDVLDFFDVNGAVFKDEDTSQESIFGECLRRRS